MKQTYPFESIYCISGDVNILCQDYETNFEWELIQTEREEILSMKKKGNTDMRQTLANFTNH